MENLSPEKQIQLVEDVAQIKLSLEILNRKFDNLPCKENTKILLEHEAFKNKAVGMAALMGLVFGLVGWILTPIISYFLKKF